MAIAEQFAGLQMDQLIGGPLSAAADASIQLANSTAAFINQVGFERNGKVRTVAFSYQRRSMNEDGTSNLDDMKVDVPMLAIVPIPNLQVDEVNILFDMEVKQSEKSEKTMDLGANLTGSLNLGIFKVNVTGSVSAHSSNTRSSDNSAKYHVDVRASNHGMPEGLARVLDMMAVNISPALLSSTLKDGNGQDLSEAAKAHAEKLKGLRQEITVLESRVNASKEVLENCIRQMKNIGASQTNAYVTKLQGLINSLPKEEKDSPTNKDTEKKHSEYSESLATIHEFWGRFQTQVGQTVKMLADSGKTDIDLAKAFLLKGVSAEGNIEDYQNSADYFAALVAANERAISAQKDASKVENALLEKKAEYNNLIVTGK